ncbi:MAG TPA: carbohydrate kinase family protein [Bryobacteraceae bacterium]|nr:carbohydrate kinase family protein [Bryobacteraceae bacterium]
MALDVITAGELYIDLVMSGLDRWPQPGEEALARHFRREAGGGAAIAAMGLARLGMNVGIVGAVGQDGAWLVETLARSGVDTRGIRAVNGESTGTTVAVSSAPDRAFVTYAGANRRFREIARTAEFNARHLHWAAPADRDLLERMRGMTISLDVGFPHATGEAMAALPLVDVFFPNEVEAARMTGEGNPEAMLRAFAQAGARMVVLKMGERGAAMLIGNRIVHGAPPSVAALDTTGAGDCFNAGFLYGWLRGKSPEQCLRLANACGALSTRALGGIAAFPTPEEIACLEK